MERMERQRKAQKSAEDVATIAKFIAYALTLDRPKKAMQALLDVPLKQLEDELNTLKVYVKALK